MNIIKKLTEIQRQLGELGIDVLAVSDKGMDDPTWDRLNILYHELGEVIDEYDRRAFPPRSGE